MSESGINTEIQNIIMELNIKTICAPAKEAESKFTINEDKTSLHISGYFCLFPLS